MDQNYEKIENRNDRKKIWCLAFTIILFLASICFYTAYIDSKNQANKSHNEINEDPAIDHHCTIHQN